MVFMGTQKIKTKNSAGAGWVSVMGEGSESAADVYVQTGEVGVSLDKTQAFDLIVLLCEGAGLQLDRTGLDGLIIQKPESDAVRLRKNQLAQMFEYNSSFSTCSIEVKRAVMYIVNNEIEAGVLK